MKKKLIPILALSLVLSACGASNSNNSGAKSSENDSGNTIKIGGIIPKTGAAAVYGNTAENGIKLAIDEINHPCHLQKYILFLFHLFHLID